jgi:hypothetical protein
MHPFILKCNGHTQFPAYTDGMSGAAFHGVGWVDVENAIIRLGKIGLRKPRHFGRVADQVVGLGTQTGNFITLFDQGFVNGGCFTGQCCRIPSAARDTWSSPTLRSG